MNFLKHRKKFKKNKLQIIAVAIFILVVLIVFVYSTNNPVSRGIARVIPFPAAFVDSSMIRVSTYYQRLQILGNLQKRKANQTEKDGVLQRLIENKIVDKLAQQRGVELGEGELEEHYAYLKKITSRTDLGKDYGLSEREFKELIVELDVISIKLQIDVARDEDINKEAYSKLQKALDELQAGKTFESVAEKYSDDRASAKIGGDLGFVSSSDLVEEFAKAVENVTDQAQHVFVSRYGIHLFKVTGKDAQGQAGQVRHDLKQIFIKTTNFTQWLNEQKSSFRIIQII